MERFAVIGDIRLKRQGYIYDPIVENNATAQTFTYHKDAHKFIRKYRTKRFVTQKIKVENGDYYFTNLHIIAIRN